MNHFARIIRPVWANPVVTRDLRMRMRGASTHWSQAAYLFLLGLIAIVGYATAFDTGADASVVDIQFKLQGFYYYIFMTLAGLIALTAPALTASAIPSERQRFTLELLITTPLTFGELLLGKLISSIAFLILLLFLSLPASALCILLGGATLGEVFRVYLLLAIDGVAMASIGVYFSCAMQKSLAAMLWTYGAILVFLGVTATALGFSGGYGSFSRGMTSPPSVCLSTLNPFVAVYYGGGYFELMGKHIPIWLGSAVLTFFLVRFMLTAASIKLGNFGGNPVGSLRRQLLFLSGAAAFCILWNSGGFSWKSAAVGKEFSVPLMLFFLGAMPFLPALFTPAFDEDNPAEQIFRSYSLRRAFRPDATGGLPFYHVWALTLAVCIVVCIWFGAGPISQEGWGWIAAILYYFSSLGFFFWAIARRCAALARTASGARAIAFACYVLISVFPFVLASLQTPYDSTTRESIMRLSIFYPLSADRHLEVSNVLMAGMLLYAIGTLAYPFWRPVIRPAKYGFVRAADPSGQ